MFQMIMGSILLIFTAGLVIKYQPKTFSAWYMCLLCGLIAVLSMVAGGGFWVLQLVQTCAQLAIAACSLFHLHREKVFAKHAAKAAVTCKATVKHKTPKQKQVLVGVATTQKQAATRNATQQTIAQLQHCA